MMRSADRKFGIRKSEFGIVGRGGQFLFFIADNTGRCYLLNATTALWPPKPRDIDRALFISCFLIAFGT